MANRVAMSDGNLDQVVGGAFNFYTSKSGQCKCHVDDVGTYNCSPEAFAWYCQRTAGERMYDAVEDIIADAIANGMFWKNN